MKNRLLSGCMVLLLLSGCDAGPQSGKGFTLPEGDIGTGAIVFTELSCNNCHSIIGNDEITQPDEAEMNIALGGKVLRIQTYGELVTSIINPSHRLAKGYPQATVAGADGQSKMENYNRVMSVQELIDLVAFLQAQYELQPYPRTTYPLYYPALP